MSRSAAQQLLSTHLRSAAPSRLLHASALRPVFGARFYSETMSGSGKLKPAARVSGQKQDVW